MSPRLLAVVTLLAALPSCSSCGDDASAAPPRAAPAARAGEPRRVVSKGLLSVDAGAAPAPSASR